MEQNHLGKSSSHQFIDIAQLTPRSARKKKIKKNENPHKYYNKASIAYLHPQKETNGQGLQMRGSPVGVRSHKSLLSSPQHSPKPQQFSLEISPGIAPDVGDSIETALQNNNNDKAKLLLRQSNYDDCEIKSDLFQRFQNAQIITFSPENQLSEDGKWVLLDYKSTQNFQNGYIFAKYMIVLKELMREQNQEFNLDVKALDKIESRTNNDKVRTKNWNLIVSEIDKIGICIDDDIKHAYTAGDINEINKLFFRIDRFAKILTGDTKILDFTNYRKPLAPNARFSHMMDSTKFNGKPTHSRRGQQQKQFLRKNQSKGVNILILQTDKPPSESESILEFILNTLCHAFDMKPRQAAALLTNNNQFLLHIVIKGIKGNFQVVENWYAEVFLFSRFLTQMFILEYETATETLEAKQILQQQTNFQKILNIISSGCYSHSPLIVNTCLKTLNVIAHDLYSTPELVKQLQKWIHDYNEHGGCFALNYVVRKQPQLVDEYLQTIKIFTKDNQAFKLFFLEMTMNYHKNLVSYFDFLNDLIPVFEKAIHKENPASRWGNLTSSINFNDNVVNAILIRCLNSAANQGLQTTKHRVVILNLLTDIWMPFQAFLNTKLTDKMFNFLQQNLSSSSRCVKIVAIINLFKLLECFAAAKNSYAPKIYKLLAFSFAVEPADETLRETYLYNFSIIFQKVQTMPLALLLEPLCKLHQTALAYQFQSFDFQFFLNVADHPKLRTDNAVLILNVLAKIYHQDVLSSQAAKVPFLAIINRFIEEEEVLNFIFKFIQLCITQYLQIFKIGLPEAAPDQKPKQKKSKNLKPHQVRKLQDQQLVLPQVHSARFQSSLDFINNNDNAYGSINQPLTGRTLEVRSTSVAALPPIEDTHENTKLRYKNSRRNLSKLSHKSTQSQNKNIPAQIEERIKKAISIRILLDLQPIFQVQDQMKLMVIKAQFQFEEKLQKHSQGLYEILNRFGMTAIQEYNRYKNKHGKSQKVALIKEKMQQSFQQALNNEENPESNPYASEQKYSTLQMKALGNRRKESANTLSPRKLQNASQIAKMAVRQKLLSDRTAKELETIKKLRQDQEVDLTNRDIQKKIKEDLNNKRISYQLQQRRLKLGVPKQVGGIKQALTAFVSKPLQESTGFNKKPIIETYETLRLVDLNIYEDQEHKMIKIFMEKFKKVWNLLFKQYRSVVSKDPLNKDSFEKINVLSLAEITTLLKDHKVFPSMIKKEEIQTIVKNISTEYPNGKTFNLMSLNYLQFLKLLVQLALLVYSRDPNNLSSLPPVDSCQALLNQFAKHNGNIYTNYYEHSDELLLHLNEQLKTQGVNDFVKPDGYKIQNIQKGNISYSIPDSMRSVISESQIVVTEVVDEFLNDALGFHILEPKVAIEYEQKVVETPQLIRAKQNVPLSLKLRIIGKENKDRPRYNEVAGVLSDILNAIESGKTYNAVKKENRSSNKAQQLKEQLQKEQEEADNKKKEKWQRRNSFLKKKIKKDKTGAEDDTGDKEPAEGDGDKHDTENTDDSKRKEEEQKKKLDKAKAARLAKYKKDREERHQEYQKTNEEEAVEKAEEDKDKKAKNKKFIKDQQQKLTTQFQNTYQARDDQIKQQGDQKEELQRLEKDIKAQLQTKLNRMLKDVKTAQNNKRQNQQIEDFLQQEDIQACLEDYDIMLKHVFKYFASIDPSKKNKNGEKNLQTLSKFMNQKEFIQFMTQCNYVPKVVNNDQSIALFKGMLRDSTSNEEQPALTINFEPQFLTVLIKIAAIMKNQQKQDSVRKATSSKVNDEKQQNQAKLAELRKQFDQEHEAKEQNQSKSETKPKPNATLNEQKRLEQKEQQYREAKKERDDILFQKWLKQKEAQTSKSKTKLSKELEAINQKKTILNAKSDEAPTLGLEGMADTDVRKVVEVMDLGGMYNAKEQEVFKALMTRQEKGGFQPEQTPSQGGDSETKSNQEPYNLPQAAKDEPASIEKEDEEPKAEEKKEGSREESKDHIKETVEAPEVFKEQEPAFEQQEQQQEQEKPKEEEQNNLNEQ